MKHLWFLIIFISVSTAFGEEIPDSDLVNLDRTLAANQETLAQYEKKMTQLFRAGKMSFLTSAIASVLSKDPKHLKALNYLGLYHLRKRHLGLARIIFERALADHPRAEELHNNLGLIALRENRKKEAILAFEKSLNYNSRYFPALVNLSSLYLEFHHHEKAKSLLSRAYPFTEAKKNRVSSRDYVKIMNNYALALTWSEEFERAEEIYNSLYKKDQMTIESLINYAILLTEYLKKYQKSVEVLNQARFVVKKSSDKETIRQLIKQARGRLK